MSQGYVDWKIHGDDTLAAYLSEDAFRSLLAKRIAVAPDNAAILIRDGQIVGAYQGAHFSVGGLWQSLKDVIGGKHAIRLLVADLKPFPIVAAANGVTKDSIEVAAEVALELALHPDRPVDIVGLVSNGRSLTRSDVWERIRPHLSERVFTHELALHDAKELRANRGLQDRIQAEFMKETERVLGDLGLLVRAVSVNWALDPEEAQAVAKRTLEREDAMRDFQLERVRREIEREAKTTIFRLETDLDVTRVRAASESELAQLVLSNELALGEARATGVRAEERRSLQHELELAQTRRLDQFQTRIGEETNELERKRIELERRRLELAFESERRRQEAELRKLEQLSELEVAGAGQDLQTKRLHDLQTLELERERERHTLSKEEFLAKHGADMDRRMQQDQTELERMRLQAGMSPDQILAIQAGFSPEVARVFAEKAKAAGGDREALLREMIDLGREARVESAEQAQKMFEQAVDRLAQVGSAAASGGTARSEKKSAPERDTTECPKCHHPVPTSDRFCKTCGNQMRT